MKNILKVNIVVLLLSVPFLIFNKLEIVAIQMLVYSAILTAFYKKMDRDGEE